MQSSTSGWSSSNHGTGDAPRIAFVLGKPPQRSEILIEVIRRLRRRRFDVAVHLPHEAPEPVPAWLFEADLVVQRGLKGGELRALLRLEEAGVRCCNPVGATLAAHDRLLLHRTLSATQLPVPSTTAATTWADAVAAGGRPVVVKARDGSGGRRVGVLLASEGVLPSSAPFEGPYVVQDLVPGDGWDRKLYVAGTHVWGVLKPALGSAAPVGVVKPLRRTHELADLALAVGPALGLQIYGVDLVAGSAPACIVDVNPFPGLREISRAAPVLARFISIRALATRGGDRGRSKRYRWLRHRAHGTHHAEL